MRTVALFDPIDLRGLHLRNRIAVSPMCQYSCNGHDGMANEWHLVHLGAHALGGAALVFTEATAVEARGRIGREDLGLWEDRQMAPLERAVRFVADHGAVPGVQLAHAGRKGSTFRPWEGRRGTVPPEEGGWRTVGPSDVPFGGHAAPLPLDAEGLRAVVGAFRAAAARALAVGFGVIELHAAHGYLLHQFLSPLSNRRTDLYGGSLANRARLTLQVVDAVRTVWPEDRPLLVRISATDWSEAGGWDVEESVELARMLAGRGVDVIDCSSGGTLPSPVIPDGPGYQVGFAARIRREAQVRTMAVGRITGAEQADTVIRSGQADLVALARVLLRNPNWPLRAARRLGVRLDPPPQYERAWR